MNRIRKREFASNVNSGQVLIKTLPGEKVQVMNSFLRAKLAEKRRTCVVVHGGTNNILQYDGSVSSESAGDIVAELLDMGQTSREFGIERIIFSGITIRRSCREGEAKRKEINSLLRSGCMEGGYVFIDNDNILLDDIENKPRDKVHLLESGSVKLANNILRVLNGIE